MAFDPGKHPRGFGGKFGRATAIFVGRLDSKERQRRIAVAVADARKFLTGETRPEWYSPQMIAKHGGRFNRDPHEAYQSALDGNLRALSVHPETEKFAGDARRRAMVRRKLSPEPRKGRALQVIRSARRR